MIITDRLFGRITITEPVIIELIKSPAFQRLKKIDQVGYYPGFFSGSPRNRFEHSIGVYYLLKLFGVPIAEQIAGLLHDVSHSAFSHAIDYIAAAGSPTTQSHQDDILSDFLNQTKIPNILKQYDYRINDLMNDQRFPLKERPLPEMCADRIDYTLRDALGEHDIEHAPARNFIDQLIIVDQQWVFKKISPARAFARLFHKLNDRYYSGKITALMFYSLKSYLQHALDQKYIKFDDLYTTDAQVLKKIAKFHRQDITLKKYWARMNNRVAYKINQTGHGAKIICKSRAIDPKFITADGKVKTLSQIDAGWRAIIKKELKPKEYFIEFEI